MTQKGWVPKSVILAFKEQQQKQKQLQQTPEPKPYGWNAIPRICEKCKVSYVPTHPKQRLCSPCSQKKKQGKRTTHCFECGRYSSELRPDGNGNKLCSFCFSKMRQFEWAKNHSADLPATHRCKLCNTVITFNEYRQFEGLCPECAVRTIKPTKVVFPPVVQSRRPFIRKNPITQVCPQCGKTFTTYRKRKYCERRCQVRANKIQRSLKYKPHPSPLAIRTCQFCGKQFSTRFPVQNYCDYDCRQGAANQRRRGNYEYDVQT